MGWTQKVEDFGRIERAEIDVRPLMLLIGDNNTGKSYLASLLWSIVAMQMELPLSVCSEYKACHAWAAEHIAPGKSPLDCVLTLEEVRMFAVLFEQAIAAGASDLIERIFHGPAPKARAVSFHASCTGPVRLRWSTGPAPDRHTLQIDDPGPKNLTTHTGGTYEDVCALAVDMLARRISFGTMTRLFLPLNLGVGCKPLLGGTSFAGSRLGVLHAARWSGQRRVRGGYPAGLVDQRSPLERRIPPGSADLPAASKASLREGLDCGSGLA